MIRALILTALIALAGCAAGQVPDAPGPVIIHNDNGGNVHAYMGRRADLARSGVEVHLSGYIASAAVIFATLPNACLERGASLHFHGASGPLDFLAERRIGATLRGEMRRLWYAEWSRSRKFVRVSRAEAMRLDPMIRACD